MPRRKDRTKKSGTARMREQGYKQCQIWFDQSEHDVVTRAAQIMGQPVATFVRSAAFDRAYAVCMEDNVQRAREAARKKLEESQ